MKKSFAFSLICMALLVRILVGCPSPHNTTIADFVGKWTATKWTETELVSPFQVVDVIANGGTWQVTVNSDGTYTATVNNGFGSTTGSINGTATIINNNTMTAQQGGQTLHITYTLSGNTWTLIHSDGTYDHFSNGTNSSRQDITATRS